MHVKAILDDELLNGIEIKKGTVYEVDNELGDYLLRAYGNRREEVKEEKVEKKPTKKSK